VNIYGITYRALGVLEEHIEVLRRHAAIDDSGRSRVERIPALRYRVRAIVVPQSPNDLTRTPDYETMNRTIEVNTTFSLQGPSPDILADFVVWHGSVFMVTDLRDYSKFGDGFIMAVCQTAQLPAAAVIDGDDLPSPTFSSPPAKRELVRTSGSQGRP